MRIESVKFRPKYVAVVRGDSCSRIAHRWHSQYCQSGVWSNNVNGSTEAIYNAIVYLGDDATPDQIAAVIGNQTWTHLSCYGCATYQVRMVAIGDDDEAKSYCLQCLAEAYALALEMEGKEAS